LVFAQITIPKNVDIYIQPNRQAEKQVSLLDRRCTMLTGVELMQWIEQFGRWNVQEFVVESRDRRDVLTFLKAERSHELAKVMPFVTADSVSFKKRTSFPPIAEEG
jgi:hypothetical protein